MKIKNWEELNNILKVKKGFIYNDFGTTNKWNTIEFNKLHKASCYHLKKITPRSVEWTYYFDSLEEAKLWLENNRKEDGYSFCKICFKKLNI